ncbi:hypothetical protein HNR46_001010 [Haloferula luteola]|uniref:Uncharacterized protein n=1 Tax=Haloferula luteola TaxID=595692 RepID=A0A840V131_9BACT|nr:hypothetical protein [Haloferula luteola]MBB5350776.1 hypothetical protein [Haloferula luteola]
MKPAKSKLIPSLVLLFVLATCGMLGRWITSLRSNNELLDSSNTRPNSTETDDSKVVKRLSTASRDRDLDRNLFRLLSIVGSIREQGEFRLPVARDLQAALDEIPIDQLLALLDRLDSKGLPSQHHQQLIDFIFGSLSRRDPALALNTYQGRKHPSAKAHQHRMAICLRSWSQRDPQAALEWFQAKQAEGSVLLSDETTTVDCTTVLKSILVQRFAAEDPTTAIELWSSMSQADQATCLKDDWFSRVSPDHQVAIANFLREQSDHDPDLLATAASLRLRQGDLNDLHGFLDLLAPSAEERAAMVSEALRVRIQDTHELRINLPEAREWIMTQSPEQAAALTGTTLAQMLEWRDFAEMSEAALRYDAHDPTQPTLTSFLLQAPETQRTEILHWASRLTDAAAREKIVARISTPTRTGAAN